MLKRQGANEVAAGLSAEQLAKHAAGAGARGAAGTGS